MYFPKVRKPRTILFDLGDTLLNGAVGNPLPYVRAGAERSHALLLERGLAVPPLKKYLGAARRRLVRAVVGAALRRREVDLMSALGRLFSGFGLPTDEELLLAVAKEFYAPMKEVSTTEEAIHSVLEALAANQHPMGIVSNTMGPGPVIDEHLREENLLGYFPVRVYSCDVGVRKPHPEMFLAALRALNAKPQHTVFVGDKPNLDVKGAQRLGMTTVLKACTSEAPKSRWKPDHVIKELRELPKLLEEISPYCFEKPPLLPRAALPSPQSSARAVQPEPGHSRTNVGTQL